ncbi:MAG: hypothetical protein ACON4H_07975 [Rubripirellula sp.]
MKAAQKCKSVKPSELSTNSKSLTLVVSLTLWLVQPSLITSADSLERSSTWTQPTESQQSQLIETALREFGVTDQAVEGAIQSLRAERENGQLDSLESVIKELSRHSILVEQIHKLTQESIESADPKVIERNLQSLKSERWQQLPKFVQQTTAAWLGRQLARNRLFDEAIVAFTTVDPIATFDPASVFFYRGACHHALLNKDAAIADLEKLLENEEECPVRYTRTAKMMLADLKPLKEDSLDEISRIMGDVTRRLDLGRAGKQVRNQEQKIIDKLDKLIEELEEQQQQQQQQQQQASSGQGGGSQGGQSSPMQDSQIAGGGGNGDVDRKKLKEKDGWGNLPPAERQEAIQQISRDLPTHYREAIEAYFRKLATDRR